MRFESSVSSLPAHAERPHHGHAGLSLVIQRCPARDIGGDSAQPTHTCAVLPDANVDALILQITLGHIRCLVRHGPRGMMTVYSRTET
jgi:hypothetical protein